MRTCVILNPAAGRGRSCGRARRAASLIPGAEIRVSPAGGCVTQIALDAIADGFQRIVAAGGDGTVSEVASAVLESGADVECGLLPSGTGNDLARSLGIPTSPGVAAQLLQAGRAARIDTIHAGADDTGPDVHVCNAIVGGFGGRISDRLTPGIKRRWRSLAYLRAAVAELGELRPHRVLLEIDGRVSEGDLLMLVIANGRYAGGGIPFSPEGRLDDGWLDIVTIRAMPVLELAALVPRVLAGRHLTCAGVEHVRARSVRVEVDSGFGYNLDGESWRDGNASFEIRPLALPFVRP